MSNFRAIATVTATLQTILQEVANRSAPGAQITVQRPGARDEALKDTAGLNLYLYRTSVNSTFRNHDTPTRNSSGTLVERPATGVDLDYLLTFYGPGVQSQLLLGQTLATLHAEPYLTRSRITAAVDASQATDNGRHLKDSNLADQPERIRLTPIPLDLEELSKLWSVFLQVPYDLSIAYRASVVLIAADASPRTALPVRQSGASTTAGMPPRLEQIMPQLIDSPDVSRIRLRGKNFAGPMDVQFGDRPPFPAPNALPSGEIEIELPPLSAGTTSVRLIRRFTSPAGERRLHSNDGVVIVRPHVKNVSFDGPQNAIRFRVLPAPVQAQAAVLMLNQLTETAAADSPPHAAAVDFQVQPGGNEVSVSLPRTIPSGRYLVRVRVDGGESLLDVDARGVYQSPTVTIP